MEEAPLTINLSTLGKHFSDEGEAYKLLERIRWSGHPVCPHCGAVDEATYLEPKGEGRKTRSGKVSPRRVWKCRACRSQFSATVGTIFERSHIPLSKWMLAVYLMCSAKNGISAHELHRTLGITYKTAWFMAHRVREAMLRSPDAAMFSGVVVADETYIGGKPSNRHKGKSTRPASGVTDKTPVVALVHPETGEVRSQVVANVDSLTLRRVLKGNVEFPETVLHTDEHRAYRAIAHIFRDHLAVNHSWGEYVRDGGGTNPAENYFSQLKRSLDGTYHHVSVEHLPRYLAEFDFRYTLRKLPDSERTLRAIVNGGGRRLMYSDSRRP